MEDTGNSGPKMKKRGKKKQGPLIKPDVMLITKNVMIPVAMPPPPGKLFPTKPPAKEKLRIIRRQRYITPITEGNDKVLVGYKDDEQTPDQVLTPVLKKRMPPRPILTTSPKLMDQDSINHPSRSIVERIYQLKFLARKREDDLKLPFPSTVSKRPKKAHWISFASGTSLYDNSVSNEVKSVNTIIQNVKNHGKERGPEPKESAKSLRNEEVMKGSIPKLCLSSSESENEKHVINRTGPKLWLINERPIKTSTESKAASSNIDESQTKAIFSNVKFDKHVNAANSLSCSERESVIKTYNYTSLSSMEKDEAPSGSTSLKLTANCKVNEIPQRKAHNYTSLSSFGKDKSLEINANGLESSKARDFIDSQESDKANSGDKNEDDHEWGKECLVKYSWQDVTTWIPPSQKQQMLAECEEAKDNKIRMRKEGDSRREAETNAKSDLDCKIKYSWQILGVETQTENEYSEMIYRSEFNKSLLSLRGNEKKKSLRIKYSWEIIGLSTQTSSILCKVDNATMPTEIYSWENLTRARISNKEETESMCEKNNENKENDSDECKKKYSWEDMIRQRLSVLEGNISTKIKYSDDADQKLGEAESSMHVGKKKTPIEPIEVCHNLQSPVRICLKKSNVSDKSTKKFCSNKNAPLKENTSIESKKNCLNFIGEKRKNYCIQEKCISENLKACETKLKIGSKTVDLAKNKTVFEKKKTSSKNLGHSREKNKEASNPKENFPIEGTTWNKNVLKDLMKNELDFEENAMKKDSVSSEISRGSFQTLKQCQSYSSVSSTLLSEIQEVIGDIESGFAVASSNVQNHRYDPEAGKTNQEDPVNENNPETQGKNTDNWEKKGNEVANDDKETKPAISGIRQIIASLDELVNAQKHMSYKYLKLHGLEGGEEISEQRRSTKTTVEEIHKVEIFPSTLHALGSYIIRDIRPSDLYDLREIPDANDTELQVDGRFQENADPAKLVHELLKDEIPFANIHLPILDGLISFNANPSRPIPCTFKEPDEPPLIVDDSDLSLDPSTTLESVLSLKETNFSCMLSYPVTFNTSYDETVFQANDRFPIFPQKANAEQWQASSSSIDGRNSVCLPLLGYNHEVDWGSLIPDMDEVIAFPADRSLVRSNQDNVVSSSLSHTNNIGPLRPRRCVDLNEPREFGESKTRKNELLQRLEGTVTKLKQCEECTEADWKLDYTILDAEKEICIQGMKLPKQAEENIKGVVESAGEYIVKLEEQLEDLNRADEQMFKCSEKTFKDIDEAYQTLMDEVCQQINHRRELVRLETEVYRNEGLVPLKACRQEVNAQIRSTQHLIVLTETMLKNPYTFNKERLTKIIAASGNMGRIPAVPLLEELPYVAFCSPSEDTKADLFGKISRFGCVLRMGPAQLTEVQERPASLRIKWYIADPEYAAEEQTFVVQKATGEVLDPTSPDFETVYEGPETSCFVRDLTVERPVTLRVGIQVSDTAWSIHRVAKTTIPPYTWDIDNKNYLITNSGKIATKVSQEISTLLSRGPQFNADHIIEFKFLEATQGTDDEGIGLVFEPKGAEENLKRIGALLITPQGKIFIDGEEKLMQLPKARLGTRIVFTTERKNEDTIRVTIESSDKAVTYDWNVETPLHFGARFLEYNKWNIMVK